MNKKPKIVTFDLETIWNIDEWAREDRAFAMSNWPGRTMKADINSIICFGYQVHGEKPKCISVWDFKHYTPDLLNDDYELCAMAYEILKDADAIVTHNGKRFDWKFLKTRMKYHGLPRLDDIIHIDTCAVARKEYSLFSNRLKDLSQFLGVEAKISTGGRQLWTRIYRGDKKAQKEMAVYCIQDVNVTTQCALAMKPEIKNWPNLNLYMGTLNNCPVPSCGSHKWQKHGRIATKTQLKQRFRCMDCGSTWSKPEGKVARL